MAFQPHVVESSVQSARRMSTASSAPSRRQSPTSSLLVHQIRSLRIWPPSLLSFFSLASPLGHAPRASTVINVFADPPRPDWNFLHASSSTSSLISLVDLKLDGASATPALCRWETPCRTQITLCLFAMVPNWSMLSPSFPLAPTVVSI